MRELSAECSKKNGKYTKEYVRREQSLSVFIIEVENAAEYLEHLQHLSIPLPAFCCRFTLFRARERR